MKKKLLSTALLLAMTLSAGSVFASPTFSGDANIEYKNSDASTSLTNRIRLNVDAPVADQLYIHGRAVMNNDLRNGSGTTAADIDQVFMGYKGENLEIKVGRQPLYLGKGLLADMDGANGVSLATNLQGLNVMGLSGKQGDTKLTAANANTTLGNVNVGASYLNKGTKAWAINADTQIAENTVLNVEYVKNTSNEATGYLAAVKFGNAVNKGETDYTISYRDIDANALVDDSYSTDANYGDSKGLRLQATHKVKDNATLDVYHDFAKNSSETINKDLTKVEFKVNF